MNILKSCTAVLEDADPSLNGAKMFIIIIVSRPRFFNVYILTNPS